MFNRNLNPYTNTSGAAWRKGRETEEFGPRGSSEEVLSQTAQKKGPGNWLLQASSWGGAALLWPVQQGRRASQPFPPGLQLSPCGRRRALSTCTKAGPPTSRALTIEALQLRLFAFWLLLKPLGLAALLAVEHEAQHSNDVGHGGAHRQPDGLDHLVGGRAAGAL